MEYSDIWNNINGSIGALIAIVAAIIATKNLPNIERSLVKFKNENLWDDEAKIKYDELKSRLYAESSEKHGPVEWKGGTDFDYLLEFRNDDNMITKEMQKKGIKKSVRYVERDKTDKNKMWVTWWYIR